MRWLFYPLTSRIRWDVLNGEVVHKIEVLAVREGKTLKEVWGFCMGRY